METLTYGSLSYTVDHAVKGEDFIRGYDSNGNIVIEFNGIKSFSGFTYSGSYTKPGECLEESANDMKCVNGEIVLRGGGPIVPPVARVVAGSYTGTGTYGEDNPNVLEFDFAPKLVIISGTQNVSEELTTMCAVCGAEKADLWYGYHYNSRCRVTLVWGDNSLRWYNSESARHQGNDADSTFHYVAIG